ncbi:anti-sigma factor [Fulvimarina sp. 2208YS6-2-32]|uniref:Anti-sigma factor n=1 Tax=Fulvimarina uroteuthidis TaxID=3098149 RepID=A0ABU5I0W3_9HYPH|nr:anti-sigma factor [Fulvimarina sp. 2208YS6-2-32]MDY8108762.1 anti-sigma factor [Fulvimarina sp. 2208YS6-2-32]
MRSDPITEFDLTAYVDDQLGVDRRIEVESYLAERPAEAAGIMADLRSRDELRLALSRMPVPVSVRTNAMAGRLERALRRRVVIRRLSRAAVLLLVAGAAWYAQDDVRTLGVRPSVASAPPPGFVQDAIRAHGTSIVRAAMISQPEIATYDPAEILSATAIRVPALPDDWTVRDVQVFPSTYGPSLEMVLGTPDHGDISLFAARPGYFDVDPVGTVVDGTSTAAFWQVGEVAYALVASQQSREALERTATRISDDLR